MPTFTRFLRVVLLPVAVLAMVAGTSASASAATLQQVGNHTTNHITVKGPVSIGLRIHPNSMNY